MISETLMEVLKDKNVVAIVTEGTKGAHMVNTWNNFIKVTEDERFLIPVGNMKQTEDNLKLNNTVQLTLGSSEVQGKFAKGTGFLLTGDAEVVYTGVEFNEMKNSFPWIRAILVVTVKSITQTL